MQRKPTRLRIQFPVSPVRIHSSHTESFHHRANNSYWKCLNNKEKSHLREHFILISVAYGRGGTMRSKIVIQIIYDKNKTCNYFLMENRSEKFPNNSIIFQFSSDGN